VGGHAASVMLVTLEWTSHPLREVREMGSVVAETRSAGEAGIQPGEDFAAGEVAAAGIVRGMAAICHPRVTMVVHLVDGTYELFRHFYGRRSGGRRDGQPFGAAAGVLHTVLQMLETGTTHVGVATDHVIESFRNDLWPGYKTGAGVDHALLAQFEPLEEALADMGVAVWPMVDLEADDALAAAARIACADDDVQQVCIWTPDKDLAQCVRGDRVVQVDRRTSSVRNAAGVREKFGVEPARIPDLLALVGDAADGYPGIPGIGKVTAARLVNRYGCLEDFPPEVLGERRDLALLFKDLATLRSSASVLSVVDELRWRGPTPAFAACAERLGDRRLVDRARSAAGPSPQR
jgi:5'-3' exonuclease